MFPENLHYMKSHEWAKLEGNLVTIGISKFAVEQLTDIVFVELPDVGDHIFKDKSFGEIESVKSVNDLYAPCDGEVLEVNEAIINDPAMISTDPYGKGWMVKIQVEPGTSLDHMLTAKQYGEQVAEH